MALVEVSFIRPHRRRWQEPDKSRMDILHYRAEQSSYLASARP